MTKPILPEISELQVPGGAPDELVSSRHSRASSGSRNSQKQFYTASHRRGLTVACEEDVQEEQFVNYTSLRFSVGLYNDYPFAQALLEGEKVREDILNKRARKQINHVKGTDGWVKSLLVFQERAMDNYAVPWFLAVLNAAICTVLFMKFDVNMEWEFLEHWDTIYSLVLKTSLAFLLVFRLNRVSVRYWESRTMWGNVTLLSRSLVGGIITHLDHAPEYRDRAIAWVGAYCVACMHFIRSEQVLPSEELWGFLSRPDIEKMLDSNHAPLSAASRVRSYLKKALSISADVPVQVAHARAIQMNLLEEKLNDLIGQISGMERIRSTPLPIVYTAHLRTFLFVYLLTLPYIWVSVWGWGTIPLVAFTSFALLGIEGASSECEVPFNVNRANHLPLDAYCLIILDNIQGLVVQAANLDMQEKQNRV